MKVRKTLWLTVIVTLTAILLSSCNMSAATPAPTVDPGAIQTEAYRIAFERQTQTAQAIPPTPIPTNTLYPTPTISGAIPTAGGINTPSIPAIPGFTPLASPVPTLPAGAVPTLTTANGCNDGLYEGESPPYDGFEIKRNGSFVKDWKVRNTGSCTWDEGYIFKQNDGWSVGIEALRGELTLIRFNNEKDFVKPGEVIALRLKLQTPGTPGSYKWCFKMYDDGGNAFGPLVCTSFTVRK